jgi:hypothetical protein
MCFRCRVSSAALEILLLIGTFRKVITKRICRRKVKQVASLLAIDKLTARDVLQAASHSSQHMQQRLAFILQFVQSASALFIVGCQDDGLA